MARWSCGYQYDCNTVLGRSFQSIRNRKCLLPSSHRNATTHDHALVAVSSLLSCTGHGLPWWSKQAFHPVWARFCSLKVAISPRMPGISPFMQHTFGRFLLWWVNIFIYQGKYSHTHALSLNNPSHQLKPKADELPFLLLRASKAPKIFFKGWMFWFKAHSSELTLPFLQLLVCCFAKLWVFANWEKKNPFLVLLNYRTFTRNLYFASEVPISQLVERGLF